MMTRVLNMGFLCQVHHVEQEKQTALAFKIVVLFYFSLNITNGLKMPKSHIFDQIWAHFEQDSPSLEMP